MQQYQLYTFAEDGSPNLPHTFSGCSDAEALRTAEVIAGQERAEVWQDIRIIGLLNLTDHKTRNTECVAAMLVG